MAGKHALDTKKPMKFKRRKIKPVEEGSGEDILLTDVKALLKRNYTDRRETEEEEEATVSFKRFDEIEVDIVELSSLGDGLGVIEEGRHVVIVPFTAPGDKVLARIHNISNEHSLADLVKVISASPMRDDTLINCKYFGRCSGCQLQMMSYSDQLEFKRNIIVKAYERYFGIQSPLIPTIDPTHGSPLQYHYRTKITPHFEIPRSRKETIEQTPNEIGFVEKGRRRILDIEECSIATVPLNIGLVEQRALAKGKKFKRGATILLREAVDTENTSTENETTGPGTEIAKKCVTDPKEIITELVNNYKFQFPAGSFFQNNNAILPSFTSYAATQILNSFSHLNLPPSTLRYLVDAYCGSGLFSITCSTGFESVVGIEISADSVKYAKLNAEMNGIENARFLVGKAEAIFEVVDTPADSTAVIIDPPRKGCDEAFLKQLIKFNPRVIIYVSCNVHTQARDIQYLLQNKESYKVTAIRGFDLFPQTHHVESIATLVRYQESDSK